MIALRAAAATDTGLVRANNQDAALVASDAHLYAVADGMGGHVGGEVASAVALDALRARAGDSLDALVEAVRQANRAVYERAEADPDLRGMGTTLCALALVHDGDQAQLAVVNVGDSRVYLLEGGDLVQLTDDHSLVEELVRQGRLTPEEARVHPQRNILTRALGNEPDVDVDHWTVTPHEGDRYLLCSDGLFNEVDDDRIAATLRTARDPRQAVDELVRLANEGGGRDNVTVVVVDVVDDDDPSLAASAALAGERTAAPGRPPAAGAGGGRDGRSAAGAGTAVLTHEEGRATARGAPPSRPPGKGPRRFTWRVGLFALAVLVVVGGAAAATAWYARSSYYVGFDGDTVAVFQGRPDGVLWFSPTLEERTSLARDDVPPARRDDLEAGKQVPTREAADRYVANLREEADALRPPAPAAPAPAPPTTAATE